MPILAIFGNFGPILPTNRWMKRSGGETWNMMLRENYIAKNIFMIIVSKNYITSLIYSKTSLNCADLMFNFVIDVVPTRRPYDSVEQYLHKRRGIQCMINKATVVFIIALLVVVIEAKFNEINIMSDDEITNYTNHQDWSEMLPTTTP
ncbi:hypothetical protein DERF_012985 [Dermatophagoides farinae]|uniref:Uncharacterized protein n=1 Tax=Dermatophagoides farinae TaxID=6954 RepID=A0A922KVN5_DERFA|nr:hypothetical protein DERF_012985 [Dermatophagoides farinae]